MTAHKGHYLLAINPTVCDMDDRLNHFARHESFMARLNSCRLITGFRNMERETRLFNGLDVNAGTECVCRSLRCDAQGARVRGLLCLASGLEHWPAIQGLEGASGGDEADISDMTYRDERVPSRILPEAQRTILQAASPNRREKAIVALLPGKVLYFVALPASTALHLTHPPVVLLPEHSNPACRRSPAKQTPSSDLTRLRSEAPLPSPP